MTNSTLSRFSEKELCGNGLVLRYVRACFEAAPQKAYALAVLLPLALLGGATLLEHRFFYGSVTTNIPDIGVVRGMSFLGDTMVWPYCFIVPFVLYLFLTVVRTTTRTLNKTLDKVEEQCRDKGDRDEVERAMDSARRILHGRGWFRLLFLLPWLISLGFWTYNTATCAFHDVFLDGAYPYHTGSTALVCSRLDAESGTCNDWVATALEESHPLDKWDCDPETAPFSTYLTRAWTLFYYGLPPFLFFRFIALVWATSHLLARLCTMQRRRLEENRPPLLPITPFSTDEFGGLGFIAQAGMMFFYQASAFILLIVMSFFKESAPPSWHNYLILIPLFALSVLGFLLPAWQVKTALQLSKETFLETLAARINAIIKPVMEGPANVTQQHNGLNNLEMLKILYDHVQAMPVWPFSVSTALRMALTTLVPVLMLLLDKLISRFL